MSNLFIKLIFFFGKQIFAKQLEYLIEASKAGTSVISYNMLSSITARAQNLKPTQTIETDKQGNKRVVRNGQVVQELGTSAGFVVDTKPDPQVAFVTNGLFVGSQDAAGNLQGLEENNVTHILNLVEGINPAFPDKFCYKTIPVLDVEDEPLSNYLQPCFEFIDSAIASNGACLVHCNAGVSRSCSVVLAYRLTKEPSLTLDEALEQLKQTRQSAKPNAGFMAQLRKLDKERN